MTGGYALHPEAFTDLDEIRDYIAQENPDAADQVIADIFDVLRSLVPFFIGDSSVRTSHRDLCGLPWYATTLSFMPRMKSPCGYWL